MKIEMDYRPKLRESRIVITIPDSFIESKCLPLPIEIRSQVAFEQGLRIIEDAVLMAMGVERKKTDLKGGNS